MEENMKNKVDYCLSCPKPRCETGCPTGNHIRDFIKALKEDNLEAAAETLYSVNPFPEITSRVCDCNRQCQGHCIRGLRGASVEIQLIERYISDHIPFTPKIGKSNGRSVALIGGGIANAAAAFELIENGYSVTFFEKEDSFGGAIYTGIPGYRFDKAYLDKIFEKLVAAGAQFHFEVEVGKDITLAEISEKFDRVIVSIGAAVEGRGGLSAKEGYSAGLTLLHDLNVDGNKQKYQNYKHAIVWGGGNVAMDVARSLIRIIPDVTIVYRRSLKEMPANADEIEDAIKEGVKVDYLNNIVELRLDENGKVTGAHCVKMELGEMDASGRASCHEIAGSDYEVDADLIVAAIGQKVNFAAVDGKLAKGEVGHLSSIPNVYLSGDAFLGPKTVAAAIHDGKDAAKEVMASF